MSIPHRTLVSSAVLAFLLLGVAACSDGTASINNAGDEPTTGGSDPTAEETCAATASVDGAGYHVVRAVSEDYRVKPTVQLDGEATDCAGEARRQMTFHAIPHVDPAWALCGLVEGRWRVFLADKMAVPADSVLAHIVLGE